MLRYFLFLAFLALNLSANATLSEEYYVKSDAIKLSDIVPDVKNDAVLYAIEQGRYTKRVKSEELLVLLGKYGFKEYDSKHSYVKFTKQSPIDVSKIEKFARDYYKKHYKEIEISSLVVNSRGYVDALPKSYALEAQSKDYLQNEGIIILKSSENKELFFDYRIDAKVGVYEARQDIRRNSELTQANVIKKSVVLDRFQSTPVQELKSSSLQSKHRVNKGDVLTLRDVEKLFLVRKGSNVNVSLDSSNMSITFSAKSSQNGCYGDVINVRKSDGKILKVKVIGKHKAEVR
jgi:flagellar basal body P-ring formation protein FlgA